MLSRPEIAALVAQAGGDPNVLTVVGNRGAKGPNRIGVWDDEIHLFSPQIHHAFLGNTDPSKSRKGHGTGIGKGMAHLEPGLYHAHGFGLHRGKYMALIQIKGAVTVKRDGDPPYLDHGMFGINIHHGGAGTSSLGCQTLPPGPTWNNFIAAARAEAKRLGQTTIPYLLHDNAGTSGLPVRHTGTVNNGSVGARVGELQTKLNAWAATQATPPFPPLKVDEDFGDGTERAVKAFQKAKGLVVDGIAGLATFGALGN